jgi:ATP-dependent DNA helicase RecG
MHLGIRDGNKFSANYACALLFANDPRCIAPGCRIRFLRFEGESEGTGEKWNAVKDEFIDGRIPVLIAGAETVIKSQLRTFSRLGAGGKFFTSTEYPEFAWYEAVVNACAHRAYGNGAKNMPIFVKMFDNKFLIESPGPFPPFVTHENIYELHSARNPFLMEAMYYLEFVRMAHEGTRRMRELMLKSELPEPEFRQDEIGHALVRVTLRNNTKQRRLWVDADVAQLLGAQVAHSLSPEEKRCVNFCGENGKINVTDAVRLVGGDWEAMKKMLERLVTREILERRYGSGVERDPKAAYYLRGTPPQKKSN